ncbi:sterigmatocystin 8-O-methyltransferase [Aaosphaeria arxii CBS 175.79]|uniref:Sterigmatocystin 8-O-methyltransferase n=1 Tax=Aaosphaeria arxii CBS 175.79 TaxID=1450172 RepID=A0A6A5XYA5_9PLEO|nr:sterigmatocystin 8-O-methyltransferase [Aaosphaeria arxii CBS 175.79]KAF2017681.1 sterigmatocystin 8-O-methyltransferase [Aaosphaeria arxii CBS 175.79]
MAETQEKLTIASLTAKVNELTTEINKYIEEKKLPTPTLSADSEQFFPELSPDLFFKRQVLLDALQDLTMLVQGPSESIFNWVAQAPSDLSSLNVLNHFNFWDAVPLDGDASYAEIAERVKLPVDVVTRILLHSTNVNLFAETNPGKANTRIKHTARTAALARSEGLQSLVHSALDEQTPPTLVLKDALERYNVGKKQLATKQEETAFALLHSGKLYEGHSSPWEFLESGTGWRSKKYTGFMRYLKDIFKLDNVILDLCDWKAAGAAHVVDVGGSAGHDAVVLAKTYPDLKVTVQDLPNVESEFDKYVPDEYKSRVTYSAHSFFNEQPVKDADIYVFKMIFHDYTEDNIVHILRQLTPALKPGSRVILLEYIGNRGESEIVLPKSIRSWGSGPDLRLMALFNSTEKAEGDWRKYVEAADKRFEVQPLKTDAQKNFYIIEAVWRG